MFYDNYVRLCNSVGKAPSAVAVELGFQKAAVTRWKKGGNPTDASVHKIADYFNVSIDYLLSSEQKEKPAAKSSELDQQLEGIDFALFGEVKDLTDEQKQDILDYIRFKKAQGQQGKQK